MSEVNESTESSCVELSIDGVGDDTLIAMVSGFVGRMTRCSQQQYHLYLAKAYEVGMCGTEAAKHALFTAVLNEMVLEAIGMVLDDEAIGMVLEDEPSIPESTTTKGKGKKKSKKDNK